MGIKENKDTELLLQRILTEWEQGGRSNSRMGYCAVEEGVSGDS